MPCGRDELRGGPALPRGDTVTAPRTLGALRTYGALAEYLPEEAGRPAAEALALVEDLLRAGHGDVVEILQVLREKMAGDWRALIAGRSPPER